MTETRSVDKPFGIPKTLVWNAYQRVKANKGAAGVDRQSVTEFEQDEQNNLYKLWNRMASGSSSRRPFGRWKSRNTVAEFGPLGFRPCPTGSHKRRWPWY